MRQLVILAVDDDETQLDIVRTSLEARGHKVSVAATVRAARASLSRTRPDLVILDRTLPDGDGLDILKSLRSETVQIPVLFLSAQGSVSDKVLGLELGAEDYLSKPFAVPELQARVDAIARRTLGSGAGPLLSHGPFRLDPESRTCTVDGNSVGLTGREFDVLQVLLEKAGKVATRNFLRARVWGYDAETEVTTKAVDMSVAGLRKKLGKRASWVQAVPGHGFKLANPAS